MLSKARGNSVDFTGKDGAQDGELLREADDVVGGLAGGRTWIGVAGAQFLP